MKKQMSITIDEDLIQILKDKHKGKMSEQINIAIRKHFEKQCPKETYDRLSQDLEKKKVILNEFITSMERKRIEGNKEERELAAASLEAERKKEEERINKIKSNYNKAIKAVFWNDFLNSIKEDQDIKNLADWAEKFQEEGIMLGVIQIREILTCFPKLLDDKKNA